MSSIAFIGAGNVAWHLAPMLDSMDYTVKAVYSPRRHRAVSLSEQLYQAEACTSLDFSNSSVRIFILAVTDNAIPAVMQSLVLPEESVLLHTSGSQPLSILENTITPHIGVFYPVQTFSRQRPAQLTNVPILFEGHTEAVEQVMVKLAKAIGAHPRRTSSRERMGVHVAAVFVSNFVNHMLTVGADVLQGKNFDLLKPLIQETIAKGLAMGPAKAQTGPAMRRDTQVIDAHLQFLAHDEAVAMIYDQLTQHIISRHFDGDTRL